MSENAFDDSPEDRIARALMMRGGQRNALMPHAFDRSQDFDGYIDPNHHGLNYEQAGTALGMLSGAAGSGYHSITPHGRGLGLIGNLLRGTAVTAGAGYAAGRTGQAIDDLGYAPLLLDKRNLGYRSMDNPSGSEERIGGGMGGPQNPEGPRYSRSPNWRVFAP